MTSTATFILNGRYRSGSRVTTTERGRGQFQAATWRVTRKRFEAARQAHEPRELTEAYLDRDGIAGVSIGALLARVRRALTPDP